MRRLLTASFAALSVLAAAPAALAQEGVNPEAVRAWVASKGGETQPVQTQDGETWFTVKDGALTWSLFFYGCQQNACGDVQYVASFANPTVTAEKVNEWNRDRRFLKAIFVPAGQGQDPATIVQYDVLVSGADVEQLNDPTGVWVGLLEAFAQHVGYFTAQPAATTGQ